MDENKSPFVAGQAVVVLNDEAVVEVLDYEISDEEEMYRVHDEETGDTFWCSREELEDFHTWWMKELDWDF